MYSEYSNRLKLLDLIDDKILCPQDVLVACLKYMSEEDVTEMARQNDFFLADWNDFYEEEE